MSDATLPVGPLVGVVLERGSGAAQTAGGLLKAARERSGLHIAALAVSLKVPVRKLEALEDDVLIESQDPVFVRALAGSVCRALKIDSAPILALLPSSVVPRLGGEDGGINRSFRTPTAGPGASWIEHLTKPVFLAALAVVVGALVLILLPDFRQTMTSRATNAQAGDSTRSGGQRMNDAAGLPLLGASAAPVGPDGSFSAELRASPALSAAGDSAVTALPTSPAALPNPGATPLAAASASGAVPAASALRPQLTLVAPAAGAASVVDDGGLLVFKAKGSVWVEGVDATGQVLIRRVLSPGETVGLSGNPPIKAVVGRMDQIEVQVRGKPFDLTPVGKDNIARFEVR